LWIRREEGNRAPVYPVVQPLTVFVRFRPLTKADLVDTVASECELSKRQTGEIIDLILDEIKAALQSGDKVQLIPFGSFVVRDRKAREGRNPKTGAKIKIPARRVPAFSAGKGLKDAVAGGKKKSSRKK
jgi:DNA-binding protein HU-beta